MATILATAAAFAVASAIAGEVTYVVNKQFDHTAENAAARDKAAEEYRQAQEKHTKERETQLDWLNEQIRQETHAEVEYKEADEAMEAYYEATGGDAAKMAAIPFVTPAPSFGDFYTPSQTVRNVEIAVFGGASIITIILVRKYLTMMKKNR
jgi:C4-dicarboxylate-specific signal transduction histidine kinase